MIFTWSISQLPPAMIPRRGGWRSADVFIGYGGLMGRSGAGVFQGGGALVAAGTQIRGEGVASPGFRMRGARPGGKALMLTPLPGAGTRRLQVRPQIPMGFDTLSPRAPRDTP